MKLKLTPAYVLSFLSLVFLVHELHDWAHVIAARFICGCWGLRTFDYWTFCAHCNTDPEFQALAWFAGPAVSYIVVWTGWWLMDPRSSPKRKSLGFSLLFSALPFTRILAAAVGGGDETLGLRQIFQQEDGGNHHLVAVAGLLLVLALTVVPLVRALNILPGWLARLLVFVPFLLLPMYPDRFIVSYCMNKLLATGFLSEPFVGGASQLVTVWFLFLAAILLLTKKSLSNLFKVSGKRATI
ncbi:MAG: hypothetical protein P4L51_11500 [Puia sp.]|nr:hypothetical protein [Puia sp.]